MTNVRSYTDIELLEKVKLVRNYKGIPGTYWILAVRSNEDETDKFDDKLCKLLDSKGFPI